jgi:ankyrin repeat protein
MLTCSFSHSPLTLFHPTSEAPPHPTLLPLPLPPLLLCSQNGATPLFLAAEAGRSDTAGLLLRAGGDPCICTSSGESPLYIASLKGHLSVVRELVHGFAERDVAWHKLCYVDGWTPLMAACLANHTAVARWLLAAAGTQQAALELIRAPNRYGQSVLHIAARKGSLQLLQLLLRGGGARAALTEVDDGGLTPMDVAKKHCHAEAVKEFHRVAMDCSS